jgi:DtxR family transcriptional regulator, iron-dependent repressor
MVLTPFSARRRSPGTMLSPTAQEYLETIYNIAAEGEPVVGARLAEKFHVAPATVTEMLHRLQRERYITMERSTGPVLTGEGLTAAEASLRQHRLAERFLAEVLGMDWIAAHEEAHALQHAMTPAIEERIVAVLGNPTTCPHGNPIPGSGLNPREYLREHRAERLSGVAPNSTVELLCTSEVVEDESTLLRYLSEKGLQPGSAITVRDNGPDEHSPLMVEVAGNHVALGREVARRIWVRPRGAAIGQAMPLASASS